MTHLQALGATDNGKAGSAALAGAIQLPAGAIQPPAGAIQLLVGAIQPTAGAVQLPAGATQLPAGATHWPAGATQHPAGSTPQPAGVTQLPLEESLIQQAEMTGNEGHPLLSQHTSHVRSAQPVLRGLRDDRVHIKGETEGSLAEPDSVKLQAQMDLVQAQIVELQRVIASAMAENAYWRAKFVEAVAGPKAV